MKKTLFIGSAVADMIIKVNCLPGSTQDVQVISRTTTPGGCAYNASAVYQQLDCPFTLFSPVGTGLYGDFMRSAFKARHIEPAISVSDQENGVCICFVERNGERTFICDHGAEYFFKPEWFNTLDMSEYDSVYICGLEIEESSGDVIIDFLEQQCKNLTIYFAPGPRLMSIARDKMKRLLQLHPVMHINQTEAADFIGFTDAKRTCEAVTKITGNRCIVTMGKDGACLCDSGGTATIVPGFPATVVDTIGAGDAHIGAFIASLKKGMSPLDAIKAANKISAAVVSTQGASLPPQTLLKMQL